MATTTLYVNTDIVGGTGSGDSPVNAASSFITLFNASGQTIGVGDVLEFDCTGTTQETYAGARLDLLALGYTGAGLLRIKGYTTTPWIWDATTYSLLDTSTDYLFQTLSAVDLEFVGWQVSLTGGASSDGYWGMFVDTTNTGFGDRTSSSVDMKGCFVDHVVGDDPPNAVFECRGDGNITSPIRYNFTDTTFSGEIQDIVNSNDYTGDLRLRVERCTIEYMERMVIWSGGSIAKENCQVIDTSIGESVLNDPGPKSHSADYACYFNCAFMTGAIASGTNLVKVENTFTPAKINTYYVDPANKNFNFIASSPLDGTGSTGNNIGSCQVDQTDSSSPFSFVSLYEKGTTTNTQITVGVAPSETCDFRVVIVNTGAPAPTTAQALLGHDSTGSAAVGDSGLIAGSTEFVEVDFVATGLDSGTTYDFYLVMEDGSSNAHVFDVLTISTTGVDGVAPVISNITATSITPTTLDFNFNINEAGDYRYIVSADGVAVPTFAQVIAGNDGSGSAAFQAGALVTGHSAGGFTHSITGLTQLTTYDFYVVARDAIPNESLVYLLEVTSGTAGGRFTGILRDWNTDVLDVSDPEIQLFASTVLGGAPVNPVVFTFATDAAGAYNIVLPEATPGVQYWVQKKSPDNRISTLNRQTAQAI